MMKEDWDIGGDLKTRTCSAVSSDAPATPLELMLPCEMGSGVRVAVGRDYRDRRTQAPGKLKFDMPLSAAQTPGANIR